MHQFTYFIGEVNFYYKNANGEKQVTVMNTGDSMYITPFVPHTFATRDGAEENGLIIALTYGNKLTGDIQQELSSISADLSQEYVLDFSSENNALSSLIKYNREIASLSLQESSLRSGITENRIEKFEKGETQPTELEVKKLAYAFNVNIRDLIPNDKTEDKVIIKHHKEGKKWFFPDSSKNYEFLELASSTTLPYSKAFEIIVNSKDDTSLDLKVGLHQYLYNVGTVNIEFNWSYENKLFRQTLHPGDSAYLKPFLKHNFRGAGKLLVLRLGGKISGESQRELSFVGKENVKRAINESLQWFDPTGKN